MSRCILAVDQSTQGTKCVLLDETGGMICRTDLPHRQLVDSRDWVEHDPDEIYRNTLAVSAAAIRKAGVDPGDVAAVGIANQRETSLMWDRSTGRPIYNAIVWQCARAAEICERRGTAQYADTIQERTGLRLSPYFPAAKLYWLMENVAEAKALAARKTLACGTIDSWLVFRLTGSHKTDYSNAGRTQLFDIVRLRWDEELCGLFSVPPESLPEVCMSDSRFGMTDLDGILQRPVPLCGVMGDSHGALFGQGCRRPGDTKATYGTGSSVMINIGKEAKFLKNGPVTSLAWGLNGSVEYVFEGNLNYTGAVIAWMKNDVGLIGTEAEATELALAANPDDRAYFVPAFSGLGAPYWDSRATGLFTGITRTTGRKELVKAGLDCIAYQIADLTALFAESLGSPLGSIRVDGGPTASRYLMQFQSDIAGIPVQVPPIEELSAVGVGLAAGISAGICDESVFRERSARRTTYYPQMPEAVRADKIEGWKQAVRMATGR